MKITATNIEGFKIRLRNNSPDTNRQWRQYSKWEEHHNMVDEVILYVSSELKKHWIKHELHKFDSGAAMIDIWVKDKFYCIQLFEEFIGLSLVTEDSGFSTIPDISYKSIQAFKADFEKILTFGEQ